MREDKGFRYIAEQVSHHPPVSCVHATGSDWTWSQALRIRSKFWGKSMEFQPEGKINLNLSGHGEDYVWNKVSTKRYIVFVLNPPPPKKKSDNHFFGN